MEIEIKGKKYVVKELKYKDLIGNTTTDQKTMLKEMIKMSTEMTEDEFNDLGVKDGIKLTNLVNEVNGLNEDFTKPQVT